MTPRPHPRRSRPVFAQHGFTLVELLFVCVVVVALLALVAPVSVSMLQSSSMNRATSLLSDELNMARQLAMTRNREVEVRFYKLAADTSTQDLQYRAFRSFIMEGDAPDQARPVGGVQRLPDGVIISSDPRHSTLFDYGNPNRTGLSKFQETPPGAAAPCDCLSFFFRPNGGTSLGPVDPPEGNWYFSYHRENAPLNADTGLPDNFGTLQVDPVTGRVRVYRP